MPFPSLSLLFISPQTPLLCSQPSFHFSSSADPLFATAKKINLEASSFLSVGTSRFPYPTKKIFGCLCQPGVSSLTYTGEVKYHSYLHCQNRSKNTNRSYYYASTAETFPNFPELQLSLMQRGYNQNNKTACWSIHLAGLKLQF